MVLDDPELLGSVEQKIKEERLDAAKAVHDVIEQLWRCLNRWTWSTCANGAADIRDVGSRLVHILLGVEPRSLAEMDDPSVVVAHDLTPSDTAQMDKSKVLGFTTNIGGRTSHSAIMARTLEIPAVVGLKTIVSEIQQGETVIVDGIEGKVIVNPSEAELDDYRKRQKQYEAEKEALKRLVSEPSVTADHVRVELAANIGSPQDAQLAKENGAEGVGLFRTEFLYMDRTDLPTEEEQFEAYNTWRRHSVNTLSSSARWTSGETRSCRI